MLRSLLARIAPLSVAAFAAALFLAPATASAHPRHGAPAAHHASAHRGAQHRAHHRAHHRHHGKHHAPRHHGHAKKH